MIKLKVTNSQILMYKEETYKLRVVIICNEKLSKFYVGDVVYIQTKFEFLGGKCDVWVTLLG